MSKTETEALDNNGKKQLLPELECELQALMRPLDERVQEELEDSYEADLDEYDLVTLHPYGTPLPERLSTPHLVIRKGLHSYGVIGEHQVDSTTWYADRLTYRCLGLLAFGLLLSPDSEETVIELLHPESEIRYLKISCPMPDLEWPEPGLFWQALAIRYLPFQEQRHVVKTRQRRDQAHWPFFALDHLDGCGTPETYAQRDTLILYGNGPEGAFGNGRGVFHFGELCLNIGWEKSQGTEFNLETPYGIGGVAGPVEVRLTLPE